MNKKCFCYTLHTFSLRIWVRITQAYYRMSNFSSDCCKYSNVGMAKTTWVCTKMWWEARANDQVIGECYNHFMQTCVIRYSFVTMLYNLPLLEIFKSRTNLAEAACWGGGITEWNKQSVGRQPVSLSVAPGCHTSSSHCCNLIVPIHCVVFVVRRYRPTSRWAPEPG